MPKIQNQRKKLMDEMDLAEESDPSGSALPSSSFSRVTSYLSFAASAILAALYASASLVRGLFCRIVLPSRPCDKARGFLLSTNIKY